MICFPYYLLASSKNIGMHNSIPEYTSTTSILKPFEKKFLKKWFSTQISSKPLKRQKKKKTRGRERKSTRVSSNKGEVNILRGEKHFDFKNPF
jgi:hypothetical protein